MIHYNRNTVEIGDIFRKYGNDYIKHRGGITPEQFKTLKAISFCRTSALGVHTIKKCDHCGNLEISYNSCRDRHCPKCQALPSKQWLKKQEQNLLPVKYYHLIFTLPSELNLLIYNNQRLLLNLFFNVTGKILTEQALECKRHLGAKIGVTTILHTWGQTLSYHPHLHCLVPAGGLSLKKKWKNCRHSNYFLPVKLLSKKFKELFLEELKKLYKKSYHELKFSNDYKSLKHKSIFYNFVKKLYISNDRALSIFKCLLIIIIYKILIKLFYMLNYIFLSILNNFLTSISINFIIIT